MFSTLQRPDYEEYLFRLYFKPEPGKDNLFLCHRRAYGDFQRTLTGIGELPRAEEAREQADEFLSHIFVEIRDTRAPTQKKFDDWHRVACKRLAKIYRDHNYPSFNVGQAQKWLNMTFKYIYVMGERRLPGFGHLYNFCHVPLDNILLKGLRQYKFPRLSCAWSRLNNYDVYLDQQRWVRNQFKSLAPLDVEFRLFMGQSLPQ
jgi:hypothetical protein